MALLDAAAEDFAFAGVDLHTASCILFSPVPRRVTGVPEDRYHQRTGGCKVAVFRSTPKLQIHA